MEDDFDSFIKNGETKTMNLRVEDGKSNDIRSVATDPLECPSSATADGDDLVGVASTSLLLLSVGEVARFNKDKPNAALPAEVYMASSFSTRLDFSTDDDDDDDTSSLLLRKEEKIVENKKVKLPEPNEGHYTIGDVTYLEGEAYAPILEPDMPIQLWIGPNDTPKKRQHSIEMMTLWKMGLILKVYDKEETITTCDVAYLRSPTDTDETIEKSIPTNRIRILLGSDDNDDDDDDGMIPNTLEEARLMLLGGEEEIMTTDDPQQSQNESSLLVVDENTGLSSWGTVSIRRVTVQKENKEERSRQRQKQRDEKRLQEEKERERLERKMEEAKHANGDDSALGAYDVWSTSGKGGYKGVNIHGGIESSSSSAKVGGERKEVVQAGALSKGKGMVAFKKRKMTVTNSSSAAAAAAAEEGKGVKTGSTNFMFSKKMNKKKKHRRTTFADDD
mmetsp:Transcript_7067/g.10350  ORF Transcript_7067/g.10350 Transcript_7067/m.10350 type:complete len:447 (+) Transcript_7067:899-2239(+)